MSLVSKALFLRDEYFGGFFAAFSTSGGLFKLTLDDHVCTNSELSHPLHNKNFFSLQCPSKKLKSHFYTCTDCLRCSLNE